MQLLQPFHQRFLSLVHLPEFQSRSPDGTVLHTLLSILEALCGLALGSRPDSIQILFSFLLPLLQTSVSILELYADSPETVRVILELFSLVAENYIVFLNEVGTSDFFSLLKSTGQFQELGRCKHYCLSIKPIRTSTCTWPPDRFYKSLISVIFQVFD